MKTIQSKIKKIVNKYIKENYSEYSAVCQAIKDKREKQRNEFASTGEEDSFIGQFTFEIPENLHAELVLKLSAEELKYYQSKEGALWFAKEYPEFSPAIKV